MNRKFEPKQIKINVRVMEGVSGNLYTVYSVKVIGDSGTQNLSRHLVLFGVNNERPRWRPLSFTLHGKPCFWDRGIKYYLSDFKPYMGTRSA